MVNYSKKEKLAIIFVLEILKGNATKDVLQRHIVFSNIMNKWSFDQSEYIESIGQKESEVYKVLTAMNDQQKDYCATLFNTITNADRNDQDINIIMRCSAKCEFPVARKLKWKELFE